MSIRLLFTLLFLALPAFATPPLKDAYTNDDCLKIYAAFKEDRPMGPRILVRAPKEGVRKFGELKDLSVLQYNVENMFNYQGKWGYNPEGKWVQLTQPKTKPEARWLKLKENILRSNPDIMTWQEVENLQAAQIFVEQHLNDAYKVILIEGNDMRGIDVALLVKKDLPFDLVVQSHREMSQDSQKIFSRDLVAVNFHAPGASVESEEPLFTIMHTHNKSQRPSYDDPTSVKKRTQQTTKQAEIAQAAEKEHPRTPIFLMGDMNSDVRSAPEFQPLWNAGFRDAFDLAPQTVSPDNRITHAYFPGGGVRSYSQLDAILVSKQGQGANNNPVKKMEIVSDLDETGRAKPPAAHMGERRKQASDHFALRMEFDFALLRERWQRHRGSEFSP